MSMFAVFYFLNHVFDHGRRQEKRISSTARLACRTLAHESCIDICGSGKAVSSPVSFSITSMSVTRSALSRSSYKRGFAEADFFLSPIFIPNRSKNILHHNNWLNTIVGFICIILYNAYKKFMRQVQLIVSFCKWKKYWDSDNISWVHFHWQMHKHVGMAMAVNLQTYDKCIVMF